MLLTRQMQRRCAGKGFWRVTVAAIPFLRRVVMPSDMIESVEPVCR